MTKPLCRNRAKRDDAIHDDGDIDRTAHSKEWEQQEGACKAGCTCSQRIDVVEQSDCASESARAASKMAD
jgi:hypothetical protein